MSEKSSKAETVVEIVRDGSLPVRDRLRWAMRMIGDGGDALAAAVKSLRSVVAPGVEASPLAGLCKVV